MMSRWEHLDTTQSGVTSVTASRLQAKGKCDRPLASTAEFADNRSDELFCVAEEHQGVIEVVEGVVDAGKTGAHAAFDHHHRVGFVDIEDGHAVDRTGSVRARGRVGHVVGADHQSDISLWEVAVNLLHLYEPVVRNVG